MSGKSGMKKKLQKLIIRVANNFSDTFPGFFKVFKVTFEPSSRPQIAKSKVFQGPVTKSLVLPRYRIQGFQGLLQHHTHIELSMISEKVDQMYSKLGIISEKFDRMYNKLGIIS